MIFQAEAVVLKKEELASGVYRLTLLAKEIAQAAKPGQFVHMRLDGGDFLLRRPFSIHRRVSARAFQVLFQRSGRGTDYLSRVETPARLDVLGPLGTGFQVPEKVERLLLVAGGLGVAPLPFLLDELSGKIDVLALVGAVNKNRILVLPDLASRARVEVVTEDGSRGRRGLVTDVLPQLIQNHRPGIVLACGPEGMLRKVALMAAEANVSCQVSLERRMACGVGACLSCVCRTVDGFERVCEEGPVFDATRIVW